MRQKTRTGRHTKSYPRWAAWPWQTKFLLINERQWWHCQRGKRQRGPTLQQLSGFFFFLPSVYGGGLAALQPRIEKKIIDNLCVFLFTFWGAEWNAPPNYPKSLKSIGFKCKGDHHFWLFVWSCFHFSLIFIDESVNLACMGNNPNHPKSLKSIGFTCKCDYPVVFLFLSCFHFSSIFIDDSVNLASVQN